MDSPAGAFWREILPTEDLDEKPPKQPPTPSARPERKLHPLAYGIERMGLVSLRFPYVVAVVLVVAAILAGFGIERIQVDDSLSQLFRSNTPEFKQYEDVTKRFPSSEFDVLVVIEGPTLLQRDSLEQATRSRHRPAADRRHARNHLAVFGAPAARRRASS